MEQEFTVISLVRAVGSPFCVSIQDGNRVNAQIAGSFDAGRGVQVSFEGVQRLTTAFLNAAIGQLYNEYDEAKIRGLIRVTDATQEDLRLLSRVVENAKRFFRDPHRHRSILRDEIGADE